MGSDTNSGSLSAPFKTFAKAASVLQAGDTLQVMAGVYIEPLTISRSGISSAPITIVGNNSILNMQGINANGLTVSGSYVNVSKFEVIGATDFGILVTGKYVTVENNVVHDNVTRNGTGTCGISSSWGSALKVKVGGENTTIRNNTVYNNCGEGIAVTRGITALVEGNTVWDNFGVNIYIDNSPFVTVQNNTSYCTGTHLRNGNRAAGIALGEEVYSGWGAQLHDILVSGNTITDCSTGVAAYESNVGGVLTNVSIINNNIPTGQKRSISLQTLTNQNVLVSNNIIFNSIYVYQPLGVTLGVNTLAGSFPTVTGSPLPTHTAIPATLKPTSTIPAATNTVVPTASPTIPATVTPIPASPTALATHTSTSTPTLPTFTPVAMQSLATATGMISSGVETIYDDRSPEITYSPGWQDVSKRQAYEHSYKLTNQNGAFASLSFIGQSFSILYTGRGDFSAVNIYLDGSFVGSIQQQMKRTAFQQKWDYPGQFSSGVHTLKLIFVAADPSGSTQGTFDAVIVR
jgi:hypothetical protein